MSNDKDNNNLGFNSAKNSKNSPKITKKSKPQKKPGRKLTTDQKVNNLDKDVIDKIIDDKKGELIAEADKIAKELVAKVDIQIDSDSLSELEKLAARLFASGKSIQQVTDTIGISIPEFEKWLKKPAFFKSINEYLFSETIVNKNERTRIEGGFLDEITKAIHAKIENQELDSMTLTTLFKLYQDTSRLIAEKVDKKEEESGNKDISVMIVNYFKNEKNKEYDNLDAFLNDPSFKFNSIIDIEGEEI